MSIARMLLEAPESQVSEDAKQLIRAWSDPPTYEEVYETTAQCCHCSLVSDFVMGILGILEESIKKEGTKPSSIE